MNTEIDREYLTWLYSQIGDTRIKNSARTHWELARQLYSKEFIWFVPNDDNRVEDGRDLRYEFLEKCHFEDPGPIWMGLPCSMLELLIGLSRRLSFEADGEPRDWFWDLINNLGLTHINDQQYNALAHDEIDDALERVIWRTYASNGRGGLFPLQSTNQDQRDVELWYQLCQYIES